MVVNYAREVPIMKMKMRIMALLMAVTMLLTAGCSANIAMDENGNITVGEVQVEETAEGSGAIDKASENTADTESAKGEDTASLPMDPSVMKPWINSSLMGMVTMDVTENYKDDFYYAVNHDWLRDAKLRPGYSIETPIWDAEDIVRERCLSLLNDKDLSGADAELIKNYYELWLDWEGRNKAGMKPIEPLVEAIQAVKTRDELTEFLLSDLNYDYGSFILPIMLYLSPDDSSVYEVNIGSPELLLDDAAEYKELTENGKRLKKFKDDTASYILGRLGMSEKEIQDTLKKAYDFDTELAKYQKTLLEMYDPSYVTEAINIVKLDDLKEMSPDFPLVQYMEKYDWAKSDIIDVEWPDSIKGLNGLYTEENVEKIKAKLLVDSAYNYINMLDEDAYRTFQKLQNEYSGITENESDQELAYQAARSAFPDSFARLYIEKFLNEDIRRDVTELCRDCIDTYRDMLDNTDWLSESTQKAAKDKLDKIKIHAVYPDKWEDYSIYHVKAKEEGGTYFEAVSDFSKAMDLRDRGRINQKIDKEIWGIDILETNAFYDHTDNSINIVPGFFCDATYSEKMSTEQKYGALGSVVGHEISHAFDTTGSQFDADGNVRDWWTKEDKEAFDERADKLVKYYDKIVAFDDGTPYQGQIVQTEAIADMAGFKCMLLMAKDIKDFNYDEFFKAHMYLLARVYTLERAESAVLSDPHPLYYLRGNVNVQQFDEFYETYDIKEGDGMYLAPEDRIAVW